MNAIGYCTVTAGSPLIVTVAGASAAMSIAAMMTTVTPVTAAA